MTRQIIARLTALPLLLALLAGRAFAQQTNSPAAADPASFVRLISERNIFNPDRRAPMPGENRRPAERRPTVTPTLTMVGMMDYAKGRFAFFDGPAAEYRKSVGAGGVIAGYTVVAIRQASVMLRPKAGKALELKMGTPLRLEGAEPVDAGPAAAAEPEKPAADAASAPTGDPGDILRKLMQKREQESK